MCIVNGERYAYHVSMAFDRWEYTVLLKTKLLASSLPMHLKFLRGKITLVKCSCDHRDIHWCHHVVALALYRIRRPERVKFRLTISGISCYTRRFIRKSIGFIALQTVYFK